MFLISIDFSVPLCANENHVLNYLADVVQSLSHVQLFAASWTAARQAVSSTISLSLIKFISMGLVMLSNRVILCRPFFLLPSVFPSIRVFSSESALHIEWPFGASASVLPVTIRDWFPLGLTGLVSSLFKETLQSLLLQPHSLKAWVLWHLAFFMVQLLTSLHDYWKKS